MHIPAKHAERSMRAMRTLIRQNPLGFLTTGLSHPDYPFLQSSHIPFILIAPEDESSTELGVLRAHMARANPQAKAMIASAKMDPSSGTYALEQEVLVLFTADPHGYVSPSWYTETKPATGKVVPTWDYCAVQVYGKATIFADAADERTSEYLQGQMEALTELSEASVGKTGDGAWKVSDAPERYIELHKKAVVGVEIRIDRIEGRSKMSQDKSPKDVEGVVAGFRSLRTEAGEKMAQGVRRAADEATAAKAAE
ncbi:Negative transcriptional regulator family protein [Rhodotorula toruloides ATCC 204091]|uniref:Negative transcriptional regulator family protein n=1 Tax=Rhodotorula toruloides TaxID=5286 RepID=A0A0K3CL58_RHOTO|nr:Negative transcriptional regulator family protein [Rhodotorula toruloides ATCC 204091]KAK4332488.1 Negative transcriptional regulator family protein [Rhodotorula toruloides]PRQ72798.1 negative transcriptional regulator family protein [Rhodotorula toruloides]